MSILSDFGFRKLVVRNLPLLEAIADHLTARDDPLHDKRRAEFMNAVDKMDAALANRILQAALCEYTGNSSVLGSLMDFCDQFGVPGDLTTMSEPDRILHIAAYRDDILRQMGSTMGTPGGER